MADRANYIKSMLGKRFGRLIPLYCVGENKRGAPICRCVCDCGNEIDVTAYYLSNGDTKSCGCLQKEKASINGSNSTPSHTHGHLWFYFDEAGEQVKVRSSYEVIYANHLIDTGTPFEYEPEVFRLANGKRYKPDFRIEGGLYIELKGWMTEGAKEKIELFRKDHELTLLFREDIEELTGFDVSIQRHFHRSRKMGIKPVDYFANRMYIGK